MGGHGNSRSSRVPSMFVSMTRVGMATSSIPRLRSTASWNPAPSQSPGAATTPRSHDSHWLLPNSLGCALDIGVPRSQTSDMSVSLLPRLGGIQFDQRNDGRTLRVSAHPETGSVTISIWRDAYCVATHQVATTEVPQLIQLLASALLPANPEVAATA